MEIINWIAIVIALVGSGVITWGAVLTTIRFVKVEMTFSNPDKKLQDRETIRYQFGTYLVLGLDFMLAADIIHTIHNPQLDELYILSIIVVIRTVISFFLYREIAQKPN
ncbi:MAG: DUF1622 domain-containing protein [Saprospiraceae bacterium]|nr:DUF1622 domain-containing protein [Saprospiraceae bacterium]